MRLCRTTTFVWCIFEGNFLAIGSEWFHYTRISMSVCAVHARWNIATMQKSIYNLRSVVTSMRSCNWRRYRDKACAPRIKIILQINLLLTRRSIAALISFNRMHSRLNFFLAGKMNFSLQESKRNLSSNRIAMSKSKTSCVEMIIPAGLIFTLLCEDFRGLAAKKVQ